MHSPLVQSTLQESTSVQIDPPQPFIQLQVLGLSQEPPFSHAGEQIALSQAVPCQPESQVQVSAPVQSPYVHPLGHSGVVQSSPLQFAEQVQSPGAVQEPFTHPSGHSAVLHGADPHPSAHSQVLGLDGHVPPLLQTVAAAQEEVLQSSPPQPSGEVLQSQVLGAVQVPLLAHAGLSHTGVSHGKLPSI